MNYPSRHVMAGAFLFGAILSGVVFVTSEVRSSLITVDCNESLSLLNPRRRCDPDARAPKREYDALEQSLIHQIETWKKEGKASHVSVYFRDLENGPLFGIEEEEVFAPASLLKVPTMIAMLREVENNPELLEKKISYEGNLPGISNVFDEDKTVLPGVEYTVAEVMRRMIVYSDNFSKELLRIELTSGERDLMQETFQELGVVPIEENGDYLIRVKSYASLFRILYNTSYLDPEYSQYALDLLSKVDFPYGLVAGVPKGTTVAHKFGVITTNQTEHQLHDCGIVYHPNTNYLLCVMTRGRSNEDTSEMIATISRMVYNAVKENAQKASSSKQN